MEKVLIGFIFGAVLGSFIKALADRSLSGTSFQGRSKCTFCKKILKWYDLFPIISYLILRGKCRYCRKKISIEYLLAEVVMGILISFLFWQNSGNFKSLIFVSGLLFKIFFISILGVLFLTDLKKMFIPDRIVLPAILISFIYLVVVTLYKIWFLYYSLSRSPLGQKLLPPHTDYFQRHAQITAEPLTQGILMAVLIAGFFMALIIITRGRGMGGGDVKLGALMGLALGFPLAPAAVVMAFLSGAVFSVILILTGKKHFGESIAFGPFLVLGSLTALFFSKEIISWYLHL